MIFFNVFLYSSILTIGLNCLYDFSKPTIIKGIIEEKYISSDSKNREHYWVIVESWRNEMEPIKIQFTIDKYNQVQIRDTLNISKMQGFLKIPWYYVSEKVE